MLAAIKLNGNKIKRCAFCKYWYDPTNEFIKPQYPKTGIWKFETTAHCVCLKRNHKTASGLSCDKFECKV